MLNQNESTGKGDKIYQKKVIENHPIRAKNSKIYTYLTNNNSFNQNKNIGHLKNSNGSLDNLLTYLRPYIISPSSAAQAANKSFKSYSETITKEMKYITIRFKHNCTM